MGMVKLIEEEFAEAARAFERAADISSGSSGVERKPNARHRTVREQALQLSRLAASVGPQDARVTFSQMRHVISRLLELEADQRTRLESRPIILGILQRRNAREWKSAAHRVFLEWAGNGLAGGKPDIKLKWRIQEGMLCLTVNMTGTAGKRGASRFNPLDLLRGLPISCLTLVGDVPATPARWARDMKIRRLDLRRSARLNSNALAGLSVEELVLSPADTDQRATWARLKGLRKIHVCPPGPTAGLAALARKGIVIESVTAMPPLAKMSDAEE